MPDIQSIADAVKPARAKGPPPVHLWNPPYCGDLDIRIAADGSWHYLGTPIGRPALVKLFASILRKDPERFVLGTPVEMVGIRVDDAPFLAVELEAADGALSLRTNVDDWTVAGPEHALEFREGEGGEIRPYVHVRGGLWARATRPVWYELVEMAEVRHVDGVDWLGVVSAGTFFRIAPASRLEQLA
jgi:uncharacterized protein